MGPGTSDNGNRSLQKAFNAEGRMFILNRPSRPIFGKGVWVGVMPKVQTYQQHRFLDLAEIQHGNAEHFWWD